MYYYIAESVTTANEKKRLEDVKTILSTLGIAGEFAVASPARSVEDHLDLAISKGFTTIVGIGSDALANRVASSLVIRRYEKGAMGVIPLDKNQVFWQLIGAKSLNEACQLLRQRTIVQIDALELNRKTAIVTEANFSQNEPVAYQASVGLYTLEGTLTDLSVITDGSVEILDRSITPKGSNNWFTQFFKAKPTNPLGLTRFSSDRWQMVTETPCQLSVHGEIFTETPLSIIYRPKVLNLIAKHARITTENVNYIGQES